MLNNIHKLITAISAPLIAILATIDSFAVVSGWIAGCVFYSLVIFRRRYIVTKQINEQHALNAINMRNNAHRTIETFKGIEEMIAS